MEFIKHYKQRREIKRTTYAENIRKKQALTVLPIFFSPMRPALSVSSRETVALERREEPGCIDVKVLVALSPDKLARPPATPRTYKSARFSLSSLPLLYLKADKSLSRLG